MRPSQFPEVQPYPELKKLLEIQVDMQFADVETMLQLPRFPDLEGGCNLALANILFTLIAGASVMFYEADSGYFAKYGAAGKRFKAILRRYYPWTAGDALAAGDASATLYKYARNPLTHSFGIGKTVKLFPGAPNNAPVPVLLTKAPLPADVAALVVAGDEKTAQTLGPTLDRSYEGLAISVPALACGTSRMLRRVFSDATQGTKANYLARHLLSGP